MVLIGIFFSLDDTSRKSTADKIYISSRRKNWNEDGIRFCSAKRRKTLIKKILIKWN